MATLTCQKCGARHRVTLEKSGIDHTMTTRRQRRRQRRAERTQRYNSDVTALVPDVRSAPDLEPGEKTTYKTPIRAQNVESDVLVPVLQALVYGGGAAVLSVWPTIWRQWPWYTPLLIWPTVAGASVFLTSVAAHRLLMVVEKWTGKDLDRDGQVGNPPPITVPHTNRKNRVHVQHRYPQIPAPAAGYEALARWFWRVYRQGGVGFSQNVALSYRVQRPECKAIQDVFTAEDWAEDRGGTQGIRPNDDGLDVMHDVIAEVYPTAALSPGATQTV